MTRLTGSKAPHNQTRERYIDERQNQSNWEERRLDQSLVKNDQASYIILRETDETEGNGHFMSLSNPHQK